MYRLLFLFAAILLSACRQSTNDQQPKDVEEFTRESRFGLSFQERMAIPPRLSVLAAEAQKKADDMYPQFRSREDAERNDAYATELKQEAKHEIMEANGLTEEQLDSITREYQYFRGAPLR